MDKPGKITDSSPSPAGEPFGVSPHGWSYVGTRESEQQAGGGVFQLTVELLDSFARMAPFLPAEEVARLKAWLVLWQQKADTLERQSELQVAVIAAAVAVIRNVSEGAGIDSAISRLHGALLELQEQTGAGRV
jgi:hypothetical protein